MSDCDLTSEQARIADDVERFVHSDMVTSQYYSVQGLAGTGKTHLLLHLAQRLRNVIQVAPTGKAAAVLRRRGGGEVLTVHQAIKTFTGMMDDDEYPTRKVPTFVNNNVDLSGMVMLADESSMIGESLAKDMFATGACVVAFGDPGQLPPVRDRRFFDHADALLTEIHRQAMESSIIRQAHVIRTTGDYASDGDDFRVVDFATPEMLLEADAVFCYTNRTRMKLNRHIRALRGFSGWLRTGEPVMCLKNDHQLCIYNGEVYTLGEDRELDDYGLVIIDERGRHITVDLATVEGESSYAERRYLDGWIPFAPAYAMTVHKGQGSEYPAILIFEEISRGPEWCQFMYTGVTRARERVTVVRWR